MNSNLLKEAIADAKAVRATSLANAKLSLDEAFNQRFSAVFADKLREDSALETTPTEQPVSETVDKDKVGATKPSKSDGTKDWSSKNTDAAGKPTAKNITPNTIPAAKDGGDGTKGLSKDNKGNPFDGTPKGVKENTTEVDKKEDEPVDEAVTNEDLEEIIRELEAEAGGSPMEDPMAGGAPGGDGAPSDLGTGEPPVEDDGTIKSGDTIVITKAPTPPTDVPGAETPGEEPTSAAGGAPTPDGGSVPPAMEEEIDLNELLASLNEEAKDGKDEEKDAKKEDKDDSDKMDEIAKSKLNEAIAQRDEAYKIVSYLRTQINEINLFNAKLLYMNKIFKEFGMDKEQKTRVVEQFDLTKNVREVKMTYANWCESLNFGGKTQRKPQVRSAVTTITEGLASKTVASTKPSPVITQGVNDMALRFKQLAGISVKK